MRKCTCGRNPGRGLAYKDNGIGTIGYVCCACGKKGPEATDPDTIEALWDEMIEEEDMASWRESLDKGFEQFKADLVWVGFMEVMLKDPNNYLIDDRLQKANTWKNLHPDAKCPSGFKSREVNVVVQDEVENPDWEKLNKTAEPIAQRLGWRVRRSL